MTARTYSAAEMREAYIHGWWESDAGLDDAKAEAHRRWPDQPSDRLTRQEVIEKAAAVEAKAYYHTEWALLDEPAKAACRERIVEILAVVEAAASVRYRYSAPPAPPAMTVREEPDPNNVGVLWRWTPENGLEYHWVGPLPDGRPYTLKQEAKP